MRKKLIAAALSILLALPVLPQTVMALDSQNQTMLLENDFVQIAVNRDNARFSVRTNEGHPLRNRDQNKQLLFQHKVPDTSFTTFRIDGKDYIFGNDYGFLGSGSQFVHRPVSQGLINQSVWRVEGLEIVQTLTLINQKDNPDVGNVKITYEVNNVSDRTVQVGSRILLDTMLGLADGAPIALSGSDSFISTEQEIKGNIPYYWRAADQPISPDVISYGFLHGWGNQRPDRLVAAHWEGISRTKWEYEINPNLDFTIKENKYGSADSAVALYWEPQLLAPGGQRVYETYYGLGSFVTSQKQAKYASQLIAPKQLQVNETRDGYVQEEFEISVDLDNTTANAERLNRVIAEIGLPEQLELVEGEQEVKTLTGIEVGETRSVVWRVKAKPQWKYTVAQYWVSLQADGEEEVVHSAFVVLPALSGALPQVQIQDVLPGKLFRNDDNQVLYVKGSGFEAMKGNMDVSVDLVRERDGKRFAITDYEVSSDIQLMLSLHEIWAAGKPEPGLYAIEIDAGEFGSFRKTIEITEDAKYQQRSYGVLVVAKNNDVYTIHLAENENGLAQLQKQNEEILLEFRGKIRELKSGDDTMYEIQPGATLNSIVQFSVSETVSKRLFNTNQTILVQKKKKGLLDSGDYIEINGDGMLSIPIFPFVHGSFKIKLVDGTSYSLDPDDDEKPVVIEWQELKWLSVVQRISKFPVRLNHAILGENSVSFGGTLALKFNFDDEEEDDDDEDDEDKGDDKDKDNKDDDEDKKEPFTLEVSVDEARFGLNDSNEFGFIGLRAQGEVGMPKDLIPGMELGGTGRVSIDTIDHIYEIEVDINFKVIETYGLMTLRFTDSMIPVPDNIVFYVGGEPGIPLVPPTVIAYITKGGGGFKHLYDTVMGNFNYLPPLKLIFVGGLDIVKVLQASHMQLEVSLRGISFDGKFTIVKLDVLKRVWGSFLIEDALDKFAVSASIGAELSIFDIITGMLYATIALDTSSSGIFGPVSMRGGANIGLTLPKKIPLIGGKNLGNVSAEVGTESISASISIIGIPVGIAYRWGESAPTFKVGEAGDLRLAMHGEEWWLTSANAPHVSLDDAGGLANQTFMDEAGEVQGALAYGTNIRKVGSSRDMLRIAHLGDLYVHSFMLAAANVHEINIGDQDYALIELRYSGDEPALDIRDPNGDPYDLKLDENYLVQEIEADISDSGTLEKRVYVSIENPMPGKWTITSSTPVEYHLYDVAAPPALTDVDVKMLSDREFEVSWQTEHLTGGEQIALYLAKDNTTDPGVLLEDSIDVHAGTATFTLSDYTPSGEYYVKAYLYRDDSTLASKYSDKLNVVNDLEPAAPMRVQAVPVGNGLLQVSWETAESPDGFMIQLLDENGEPLQHAGEIEVDGDVREVVIGGVFESIGDESAPDDEGEVFGLLPDQSYMVAVSAFRQVNGVNLYGMPGLAEPVHLPEPDPAELAMSIDSEHGLVQEVTDEEGNPAYLVNDLAAVLHLASDQIVEATVQLNDETVAVLDKGTEWKLPLLLQEGANWLRVVAVNEAGDQSDKGIRIIADTTAPDLKIESDITAHLATDGTLPVKGVAELGSRVTINGQPVQLDDQGRFEAEVSMEGFLSRTLSVQAEDRAGNRTIYEAFAVDESADAIENVEIRVAEAEAHRWTLAERTLEAGVRDSVPLELIGFDSSGKEYKIAAENVEWNVLLGDQYGSLSPDGTLLVQYEGEMVITASFEIADGYALEDSIIVQVTDSGSPDPGSGTDPGDYDEWYVPPRYDDYIPPVEQEEPGKPGADGNEQDRIDDILLSMLQSIIEAEAGVQFLRSAVLESGQELIIPLENDAVLHIRPQSWEDGTGIGIGKVMDPAPYATRGMEILSPIYEFKLNKPVAFAQSPILSIRFALDDAEDPQKLGIYWYNERSGRWEYIGREFNPVMGAVSAELPHFSKYALIYNGNMRVFADLSGRWSEDMIYRLSSIGIVDGVPKDGGYVFEPGRAIARQEFAKLLLAAAGADGSGLTAPELGDEFADRHEVSPWARPYMAQAVERGWLTGSMDNGQLKLHPLRPITRAEAAAMTVRMMAAALEPETEHAPNFKDQQAIPSWARSAVGWLQAEGVLNGYPDGTFRPNEAITREEGAALIMKVLDLFYRKGRNLPN